MDAPAYLVVFAEVKDPGAMAAYQRALEEEGLYAAHGGRYLVRGRAAVELEGWEGHAVVVSRFPSRAAAEAFWASEAYQRRVKPLRAAAGRFRVALFDAAPGAEPA